MKAVDEGGTFLEVRSFKICESAQDPLTFCIGLLGVCGVHFHAAVRCEAQLRPDEGEWTEMFVYWFCFGVCSSEIVVFCALLRIWIRTR